MSERWQLAVEIWGERGSMPTPGEKTLRYGGNTTCISVRSAAGDRVVVDGGTGIRKLGKQLMNEREIDLFFTHFHWDHIQGLPFFAPLIQGGPKIRLHAGIGEREIRARLERQMSDPFFTLDFHATKAECEFREIANQVTRVGELTVEAFPLNHPQGAWGYRIASDGAAVIVATDLEHGNATLDKVLREKAADADVLIYDAQYTDAEYAKKVGWGHSTPSEAAKVAADAKVKKLLLFHHDPERGDDEMDHIVEQTKKLFPATEGAREGSVITIAGT